MRLLRLAVTAVAALYTMSVLCAFASQAEVKIPAEDDSVHYCRTHLSDEEKLLYDSLLTCALSEDPAVREIHAPAKRGEEFRRIAERLIQLFC